MFPLPFTTRLFIAFQSAGNDFSRDCDMGQSIQEWTKSNLWKTAFKKFEGVRSTLRKSANFTWLILEYFDSYIGMESFPVHFENGVFEIIRTYIHFVERF